MCGRFTLKTTTVRLLTGRFRAQPDERALACQEPRFNIAPTQEVLAVLAGAVPRRLTALRWGLIPSWARDATGPVLFNARGETLAEKPAFRSAFQQRRCLIPADSFYEWMKQPDGKKHPVRILLKSEDVFAFAGLWSPWFDPVARAERLTCAIVTTTPNELLRPVHDRMPVILSAAAEAAWMDPASRAEDLQTWLRPYPDADMRFEPVSPEEGQAWGLFKRPAPATPAASNDLTLPGFRE